MTNKTILEAQAEALEDAIHDCFFAGCEADHVMARMEKMVANLRAQAEAAQPTEAEEDMGWLIDAATEGELKSYDAACIEYCAATLKILDGKDNGEGTCREPWASVRKRLLALRGQQAAEQPEGEKGERDNWNERRIEKLRVALKAIGIGNVDDRFQSYANDALDEDDGFRDADRQAARSLQAQAVEGDAAYPKCHCVGAYGPNPDCGLCGGDGTYGPVDALIATPPTQQEALAPVGEGHIHTWMPYFKGPLQTGWVCAICNEKRTEGDFTPSPQAVPEEFVLVPREPTDAMLDAAWKDGTEAGGIQNLNNAWIAMLSAAPPAPAKDGWMPIESAPKDGKWFLAISKWGRIRMVRWADKYDHLPINDEEKMWDTQPTHWQSLPLPPKE